MQERLWAVCALAATLSLTVGCAPAKPPAVQSDNLVVSVLYPKPTSTAEMGQSLKCLVSVLDQRGVAVRDAQVVVSVSDPSGKLIGRLPAMLGSGDVYRTSAWPIAHRLEEGIWTIRAEADTGSDRGTASTTFRVKNSLSENLLSKYGFWIESPALRGITPDLFKEQGDAQNGAIIWGGVLPAQHIFPESWLEVQWREGDFKLSTGEQVRAFMLGALGDLGFTPVRDLGPFDQTKFKTWDAWQVRARGQFSRYDEEWMIFYAPEVRKTYAIGTTVVLPPVGIDAHATLRDSFEVHPEIPARGVAPEPLPRLLPAPELIGPELGRRVVGTDSPIVLNWKPMKNLATDEYYRVRVDYNYDEANTTVDYSTRETQLTLPETLYQLPNCGVFNWTVTLMQRTGLGEDGQPEGRALSYVSLYWYVEWFHPLGAEVPFKPLCPNPQT